jgi:Sulfotransferase family
MNPAPFFIVGSGRSGSTLLRMILASHSRLVIPPETWFVRLLIKRLSNDRPLTQQEVREAACIVTNHYRWSDMAIDTDRFRRELAALEAPLLSQVIEVIYQYHMRREGKVRWGDKTPGYIEVIPQLAQMFPGSRFIHLLRDGRDVTRSFQATGWYGPWLHDNTAEWLESLDYDERWACSSFADRILTVRYEDLVLETDATVRRICGFLGEKFEQQMLHWQDRVDRLVPTREMQIHVRLKHRPDWRDEGRWKREMSAREIFVCEAFMGRHLARTGYERRFKSALWTPAFAVTRWYCQHVLPVVGFPIKALWLISAWRKRALSHGRQVDVTERSG